MTQKLEVGQHRESQRSLGLLLIMLPCTAPPSALTAQNVGDEGWSGSRCYQQRSGEHAQKEE